MMETILLRLQETQKKELLDFFNWVLTNGQQFVNVAGYVPLPKGALSEQLKKVGK